jgi:hypothetical protein
MNLTSRPRKETDQVSGFAQPFDLHWWRQAIGAGMNHSWAHLLLRR